VAREICLDQKFFEKGILVISSLSLFLDPDFVVTIFLEGTHDDRLWPIAFAIYASRHDIPTYHPVAAVGLRPSPGNLFPQLP